jgi:hypothetical protein
MALAAVRRLPPETLPPDISRKFTQIQQWDKMPSYLLIHPTAKTAPPTFSARIFFR